MRAADIAGMCAQNLRRRRARTLLTALGVMVGTCSIVIMVSIGFGLSEQMERTLAQMGDLSVITVYGAQGSSSDAAKLDDEALDEMRRIPGVAAASGKLSLDGYSVSVSLAAGTGDRYTCGWATVVGMDSAALPEVGYAPERGQVIESLAARGQQGATGAEVEALAGQWLAYNFTDAYKPEGSNSIDRYSYLYDASGNAADPSSVPDPFFDPMETPLSLIVSDYEGNVLARRTLKVTGVLAEDYSKGWETSEGLVVDADDLRAILKEAQATSSQDLTQSGSGSSSAGQYESAIVKATGIDAVAAAEDEIRALGFNTNSMASVREPMEEQARQQQLMLGGLGAISLVVAAIGITNTMVMSISERTREIGVMKALGCYVRDIKALFLAEAGAIGLLGGVAGCLVSFAASLGMNLFQAGRPSWENVTWALLGGEAARMSVIPWWLYLFAIGFSLLVGVGSGYYPARRAVKIEALAAIRGE